MCDQEHPIQAFMTLKDFNQIEAAEALDCASSTISRILRDDRWPAAEMIDAIERKSAGLISFKSFQDYFRGRVASEGATDAA
ncbi:helix-turn-helix transcriptional regulator [uncultured Cohaesibacter sp.]|uniref:helix-turn-helix domain-containing protein n=1 Tax=uncultured Cohaesibacter sp. TaxID=1002546 RepID=UPI0029C8893B|nr:helix-turn-helix transcriptional regulator [uncultured Cohaesibacter sp.]